MATPHPSTIAYVFTLTLIEQTFDEITVIYRNGKLKGLTPKEDSHHITNPYIKPPLSEEEAELIIGLFEDQNNTVTEEFLTNELKDIFTISAFEVIDGGADVVLYESGRENLCTIFLSELTGRPVDCFVQSTGEQNQRCLEFLTSAINKNIKTPTGPDYRLLYNSLNSCFNIAEYIPIG